MIDATQIAAAMQVSCLLSGDMIQQMQLWEELYLNRAGWIRNRIRSCHIPANIAQELKRLTLTEFSATVHDAADTHHSEPLLPVCQSGNTGHRVQSGCSAAVGGCIAGKGV